MKKYKGLFIKSNQPMALEVIGYVLFLAIFGTAVLICPAKEDLPVYLITGVLIATLVCAVYRLIIAHGDLITASFCKMAGVPPDSCTPKDKYWYASLGATIFVPVLLSFFSVPYLLSTSFKANPVIVIIGTIIMATIIFIIDRGFVVTMGHKKNWWMVVIRIAIAAVIALFVTKPIEMALFNQEIQQELTAQRISALENIEKDRQQENARLEQKKTDARSELDRARKAYEDEVNLSIGGRNPGHGTEADKKEAYWLLQDSLYRIQESVINQEITDANSKFDNQKAEWTDNQSIGLGARMNALEKAGKKYPAIATMEWIIFLFFMLIDISPILMKALMPRSKYDIEQEESIDKLTNRLEIQQTKYKYSLFKTELEEALNVVNTLNLPENHKEKIITVVRNRTIRGAFGHEALNNMSSKN